MTYQRKVTAHYPELHERQKERPQAQACLILSLPDQGPHLSGLLKPSRCPEQSSHNLAVLHPDLCPSAFAAFLEKDQMFENLFFCRQTADSTYRNHRKTSEANEILNKTKR